MTATSSRIIDVFGVPGFDAGKRVGIIGTGAIAVQCIPHLGEWAGQLYQPETARGAGPYEGRLAADFAEAAERVTPRAVPRSRPSASGWPGRGRRSRGRRA